MINSVDPVQFLGTVLLTWLPLATLAYFHFWKPTLARRFPGKAIVIVLAVVSILLVGAYTLQGSGPLLFAAAGAITWELANRFSRMDRRLELLVFFGLLLLGGMILVVASAGRSPFLSNFPASFLGIFLWPALNVAFFTFLFQRAAESLGGRSQGDVRQETRWEAIGWVLIRALMALSLFVFIAYLQLFMTAWDSATDGVGGAIFLFVYVFCLMGGGLYLVLQRKWTHTAAAAVLVAAFFFGLQKAADFYPWPAKNPLTEVHANVVDGAIQRYYRSLGRYPESLAELTPRYLPFLPQPIMFRVRGWCYQGGQDFYRLGYLYSQYFLPSPEDITIKVHNEAGRPPAQVWVCDEALDQMRYNLP